MRLQIHSWVVALAAFSVDLVSAKRPPHIPKRPNIEPSPYDAGQPFPCSPARDKDRYCHVKPSCSREDDAPNILKAFHKCNDGGTVVLDKSYTIGSPLDLTFLKHIDIVITGEIGFTDDVYYWAEHSFKYAFQNQSVFWKFGGEDVNMYGDLSRKGSTINGHGQAWWEEFANNKTLLRPMLMSFDGMTGATVSNLRMRDPPNWFNIIANSTDILVSNMDLQAKSATDTPVKNSDGWDTYRADRIIIQNSVIDNTDDCVSFKPNSTNVVVQGLVCNGSHGISVGSLGQYYGEVDIIENLYIFNTSMSNASDGARIKVWADRPPNSTAPDAGGGLGHVHNVTYDTFYHNNNDNAITLMQCYNSESSELCYEYPAKLTIDDITMKNMWGVTSAKYDPRAGALLCSSPDVCTNIRAENISIQVPSGEPPVYQCAQLDESLLDLTCVDPNE